MIATDSPVNHEGSNDVDRALGAFFRGEVPNPWPPLSAPIKAPAAVHRTRTLWLGRVALAASVAALFFGGWLVSGRLTVPTPVTGSPETGGATLPRDMQHRGAPPIHRQP